MNTKKFNVHVVATNSVSNDKMCKVARLIDNMISCLKYRQDHFNGHKIILIGSSDPPFNVKKDGSPQRNTGMLNYTVLDVDMINHVAIDKITGEQFYRGWNVPIHEFGHTIEFKLDLTGKSDIIFPQNIQNYNIDTHREYFPWATEKWFNNNRYNVTRDSMPEWEYAYLSTVFDSNNTWFPVKGYW